LDDFEDDELMTNFTKAANSVQKLASALDNETLLILYGYYKQALEGKCVAPKPSWYDMRGKSKWEAWNKLGDMPQLVAKKNYIDLVNKLDPSSTASPAVSREFWVTVSTMQKPIDLDDPSEKTIVDYIKTGDVGNVMKSITENQQTIKENVNNLDGDGLALIHWAADRGSVDIIKLLIEQGANVNVTDNDGQTPLHYAVSCAHVDCIEYLLEVGADPCVKDSDGLDCFAAASDDCVKGILSNYNCS